MKSLPTAQELHKASPDAFKRLLLAVDELQRNSVQVDDLVATGLVRKGTRNQLYNPAVTDSTPFDTASNQVPDAPTALTVTTTSNLAFLQWINPYFQPVISHAEVWVLSAPSFREDLDYAIGDFVTYSSTVYLFTSAHTAAVWDAGDVSAAGAGDLITDNAQDRYLTPINSAVVPLDLVGGTAYFWVRLITDEGTEGIAGEFSSATPVVGEAKSLAGDFPIGVEVSSQASPGALFLELNGQTVTRASYQEFWTWATSIAQVEAGKAAGQYGDGNGSTTFSLPDYRGRVLVGKSAAGTFSTLGSVGGAETVTLTSSEMPSHTHTQDAHNHTQDAHNHTQDAHSHGQQVDTAALTLGVNGSLGADGTNDTTVGTTGSTTATNQAATATNQATTATNQSTGGGGAHANLQPYAVTRYWVRAKP